MIKKDGGSGLFYPIQVTFLILKLAGLVDWEWAFVFSPSLLWLGILIVYLILKPYADGKVKL